MKKLFVLIPFLFLACQSTPPKPAESAVQKPCQEIRAAFDIGSSSTKMKVAKVEICEKRKILKVYAEETEKLNFEDDVAKSRSKEISAKLQMEAIETVRKLKRKAEKLGATKFFAVATGSLAEAQNGVSFLPKFSKESGVDILILDEKEKAELGFQSGLVSYEMHRGLDPSEVASDESAEGHLVVWNIDGSTQEISFVDSANQVNGFNRPYGSLVFRNRVIAKIKPGRHSPNPIGKKNKAKVLDLAQTEAAQFSYEYKLQSPQGGNIVGIGGAHLGIGKRIGKTSFTADDLDHAIDKWIDKSDQQVGGRYADTEITNLVLVLAFMRELGIEKVDIFDANLADGLLAGRD